MTIISGPICQCQHTHVYGGNAYRDCPYCDCHEHSKLFGDSIYNVKRFNRWVRQHNKPNKVKNNIIDIEIQQMINSIQLV